MINNIIEILDGAQQTVGVLCDLSKAFICIDHGILLEKLNRHGIKNIEQNWFTS